MEHFMLDKFIDVGSLSKKRCVKPIVGTLKYATVENFLGRVVKGYHPDASDVFLATTEAAFALCEAQNYFVNNYGYSLTIHDSYRPLCAVQDFAVWVKQPPNGEYELFRKQLHYPAIEKIDFEKLGYLSVTVSRHCFGNVVDATLISLEDGKEINMGAIFDFFDKKSHAMATAAEIGEEAFKNRKIFREGMEKFGFNPYSEEYWHFEFHKREIDIPADMEITQSLRGLGVPANV